MHHGEVDGLVKRRAIGGSHQHNLCARRHSMHPLNVEGDLISPAATVRTDDVGIVDQARCLEQREIHRRQAVNRRENRRVFENRGRAVSIGDDYRLSRAIQALGVQRVHVVSSLHLAGLVATGREVSEAAGYIGAVAVAGIGCGAGRSGKGMRFHAAETLRFEEHAARHATGKRRERHGLAISLGGAHVQRLEAVIVHAGDGRHLRAGHIVDRWIAGVRPVADSIQTVVIDLNVEGLLDIADGALHLYIEVVLCH